MACRETVRALLTSHASLQAEQSHVAPALFRGFGCLLPEPAAGDAVAMMCMEAAIDPKLLKKP
jgi:hypothetical protein